MSYGITAIAVSLEHVESVIGDDRTPRFLRLVLGSTTDRLIHEIRESVMQIRGWLKRCEELKCDLVCFYY